MCGLTVSAPPDGNASHNSYGQRSDMVCGPYHQYEAPTLRPRKLPPESNQGRCLMCDYAHESGIVDIIGVPTEMQPRKHVDRCVG